MSITKELAYVDWNANYTISKKLIRLHAASLISPQTPRENLVADWTGTRDNGDKMLFYPNSFKLVSLLYFDALHSPHNYNVKGMTFCCPCLVSDHLSL